MVKKERVLRLLDRVVRSYSSKYMILIDETLSGVTLSERRFSLSEPQISVRELIRMRLSEEALATGNASVEHPLMRPQVADAPIDVAEQWRVACEAFQTNHFFILIDDRQVEDLDEVLRISETSRVSFIKLIPLIGG